MQLSLGGDGTPTHSSQPGTLPSCHLGRHQIMMMMMVDFSQGDYSITKQAYLTLMC